jgi:hypothetical protein
MRKLIKTQVEVSKDEKTFSIVEHGIVDGLS